MLRSPVLQVVPLRRLSPTASLDVTTVQVGDRIVMVAISYRTNTVTLADIIDPFNVKYMNTIQSGQPLIFIRNPESTESLTGGIKPL